MSLVNVMKFLGVAALSTGLALAMGCNAENVDAAKATTASKSKALSDAEIDAIKAKFSRARPDLQIGEVKASEVDGIVRVEFEGNRGGVYAVRSGDFFFTGDLYSLQKNEMVNLTEQAKNGPRAELMAAVKKEDMIVFSPKGKVKASIAVFTDVDCGYCRKLHQEVPKLNEMGIEVRYLAYPRAGVGSPSYDKIASAWCADDPLTAMTTLKNGQEIPTNVCDGNPVALQFDLGQQVGLSGTPAIVLDNGRLIPGYMPAERLASEIGI